MFFCCCPGCKISDDFNRADSDSIGSRWIVDSGDWEILDEQLKGTGPDAIVRWRGSNPRGAAGLQSASVKIATEIDGTLDRIEFGARFRVILARADEENFVAAEFQERTDGDSDDGWLAIISCVGGSETVTKWEHFALTPRAMHVCYRPEVGATPATLTAWAVCSAAFAPTYIPLCWHAEVANTGGKRGGLAVMDGEVSFDDWAFGQNYAYQDGEYSTHEDFPDAVRPVFGQPPIERPCFDVFPRPCGRQSYSSNIHTNNQVNFSPDDATIGTARNVTGDIWIHYGVHNRAGWQNQRIHTTILPAVLATLRARLILNWLDDENYLYAECKVYYSPNPQEVHLKIYEVVAGVETELSADEFQWNQTPYYFTVCYEDGTITARTESLDPFDIGPEVFSITATGITPFEDGYYTGYEQNPANAAWVGEVYARGIATDQSPWDEDCIECDLLFDDE